MSGGNGRIPRIPRPVDVVDLGIAGVQSRQTPEERFPIVHRIRLDLTVMVRAARRLTAAELVEAGRHVALGEQTSLDGFAGPLPDTLSLEVVLPECRDTGHRRNSIDGRTYQCGFPAEDGIHDSIEACEAERGEPCKIPSEHHAYVSPGFEAPVGSAG